MSRHDMTKKRQQKDKDNDNDRDNDRDVQRTPSKRDPVFENNNLNIRSDPSINRDNIHNSCDVFMSIEERNCSKREVEKN